MARCTQAETPRDVDAVHRGVNFSHAREVYASMFDSVEVVSEGREVGLGAIAEEFHVGGEHCPAIDAVVVDPSRKVGHDSLVGADKGSVAHVNIIETVYLL